MVAEFKRRPILRIAAIAIMAVMATLLILSAVAPIPSGTFGTDFLSIGTSYPVSASPDWLSGWDQRVKLTVDAGDIDSDLTHFPILLHLSSSCGRNGDDVTFVFDELGSDDNRFKIAVTKDDGVIQCDIEIESWNTTAEEAWLWVSNSTWVLDDTEDTELYLYYDADHADNTDYVKDVNPAVWDSNFLRVDHCRVGADEGITEFNTATYDSNPLIVHIGADTILMHYTQATSHDSGVGYIYEKRYTISTATWGASTLILDPTVGSGGDSHMLYGIAGGLLDGHFIHFFSEYAGSGAGTTMHWIRSYDADCDSWVLTPAVFTGSGLDDCTSGGEFQDASKGWYEFVVEIDGTGTPNTFKWSNDGGGSWEDTEVAITGSPQVLENGATVTFGATTGHTSGDKWEFSNVFNYTHAAGAFRCNPHGNICETSIAGTYLQTFYVRKTEASPYTWSIHTLKTTDYGVTWAYNSAIVAEQTVAAYTEPSAAYIGDGKLVCHIRNDLWDQVYQTTSDDDGDTWSDDPPLATSLGLGIYTNSCAYPWLYYDSTNDCLVSLYQDRWSTETQWMMMSRCDAATAYGDRTKWNGQYLETVFLGGGSVLNLEGNKYLLVYSNQKSFLADADIRYTFHYLKDSTVNGLDGRFLGSMTTDDLVASDIGNGIDFDGTNDYIKITDNAPMSAMTSGFTLEMRITASVAAEYQALLFKRDASGLGEFILLAHGNPPTFCRLRLVCYDQSASAYIGREDTNSSATLYDGNPHLATTVYEGGTSSSNIKVYQDGAAVDDADVKSGTFVAIENTAVDVTIGSPNGVAGLEYFKGIADEVRISNIGRGVAWVKATSETESDDLLDWETEETPTPEITNTQSSWTIGIVAVNDIKYFSADNTQDDDYAQITNTGNCAVDVVIQGENIEGGSYDWILASSAASEQYSLYANSEATPAVYDIEVKSSSYNNLCTDLAEDDTYNWSMKLTAPTAFNANDDGEQKSCTVTLVASMAS